MIKSINDPWTILKVVPQNKNLNPDAPCGSKSVFFDFKGSFLSFVFEFGIFWSKAKLIFGQFRAILLLGPSKSGRSLWVKKWISFFTTGVTAEEQQQQQEEESFVVIV